MKEILDNFKLVLASGSPRRKSILEEADIPFSVRVISIDEQFPSDTKPHDVPAYLARKKAQAHKFIGSDEILLTADSVVIHENNILEKPRDYQEAYAMLSALSGGQHEVTTAFCLRYMEEYEIESVTSKVWFNRITHEEIDYYVRTYKPYDKAGAYGIQEWIGHTAVSRIEGSYLNIVGLPMEAVYNNLRQFIGRLKK